MCKSLILRATSGRSFLRTRDFGVAFGASRSAKPPKPLMVGVDYKPARVGRDASEIAVSLRDL
jgi:hypothetical protein